MHASQASTRLSSSVLTLTLLLITVYLAPLPTLGQAFSLTYFYTFGDGIGGEETWLWRYLAFSEVFLTAALTLNIIQASYSFSHAVPTLPTPAKTKSKPPALSTPARSIKKVGLGLTPNASPQPQKPFGASLSRSKSQSTNNANSSFSSSPFTPPRSSNLGSVNQTPGTPTPTGMGAGSPSILSAYRGMHKSGSVGRPFDAASLTHLARETSSDDEL